MFAVTLANANGDNDALGGSSLVMETKASGLSIAAIVLANAIKSEHPVEQATAELGTYLDLAQKEAPGNLYSAQLMTVLRDLERGIPIEQLREEISPHLPPMLQKLSRSS